MPKTKFQGIVFGIIMSITMALGMELYNVSIKMGGMSNAVFPAAVLEAAYMWIFVFITSTLFGNRIGRHMAFKHVTPGKDNPFFITIMISSCTVGIMCPTMSLIATVLFFGVDVQFIANWIATVIKNFPMALLWQLFAAGPFTRFAFRTLFRRQLAEQEKPSESAQPHSAQTA